MLYLSKKQNNNVFYFFLLSVSTALIILQHIKGVFIFEINNVLFNLNKKIETTDLKISNAILREQNKILKNQIQEITENKQINAKISQKYKVISFLNIKYISKNQNGHFVITDANDNLSMYDLVIDNEKNIIGRIIDFNFYKTIAKIQLISDKNFFIPIKSSKNNSYGIISWRQRN